MPSQVNPAARTLSGARVAFLGLSLVLGGAAEAISQSPASWAPKEPLSIWFDAPAQQWLEALPLGTGRLGAMVFGDVEKERVQLSLDALWSGEATHSLDRGTPADLIAIRQLLATGDEVAASRLATQSFQSGDSAWSHQTLGDLHIQRLDDLGAITSYRRVLNLRDGIATSAWQRDGANEQVEVFASGRDQVLVWHAQSAHPSGLHLEFRLSRPQDHGDDTATATLANDHTIELRGELTQRSSAEDPERRWQTFVARGALHCEGGRIESAGSNLRVIGARAVQFVLAGECTFEGADPARRAQQRIEAARQFDHRALLERHRIEHRAWMNRCELEIGDAAEAMTQTTAQRLRAVAEGVPDPSLAALFFQYGRYLLIACSRPGTQPANLQGLWNDHIDAPWNADYHLNINLQMNTWPAEVTGLGELMEPYFGLVERLATAGAVRAQNSFGARGWVAGHATDLWGTVYTRSSQPYWGFWHASNAWLAAAFFEHWRYHGDRAFLRDRAWPILRGAALFYLDWLVADDAGQLVSGPSTSPENSFRTQSGETASVCMGPAMDQQLIAELFQNTLAAAEVLDIEDAFVAELKAANAALKPGVVIAHDGRILEWDREREEAEPGHRHLSHLYALHPSDAIEPDLTPAAAQAARASIEERLKHGGGGTGWSRAWLISMLARLHDGDAAEEHLHYLLTHSVAPNLFDLHPPFQIDGNFGATAGIAEMLLQSERGIIEVLPALPSAWTRGAYRGLRARGGVSVDCRWNAAGLEEARLTALRDTALQLRLRRGESVWNERTGKAQQGTWNAKVFTTSVSKGEVLLLRPRHSGAEARVRAELLRGVIDGVFPGAVCEVGTARGVLFRASAGHFDLTGERAMEEEAIFDLASLTKVIATTSLALRCVADGRLALDRELTVELPLLTRQDAPAFTMRQALLHCTGLPAWLPLHRNHSSRAGYLRMIASAERSSDPGARYLYSDLGMITLGAAIEVASESQLDELFEREIAVPLGLVNTTYRVPLSQLLSCVPTERCALRDRVLRGEVHDENAYGLGGVAGHAGLFSNARDLGVFARCLLNAGRHGDQQIFDPELLEEFTTRADHPEGSRRALGWDTAAGGESPAGATFSARAYGHTGFTGTSLWIDPEASLYVVLLTNRVHPSRENKAILNFRPRLHAAVLPVLEPR